MVVHHRMEHVHGRCAAERGVPGQHLEQHEPRRKDVGAAIHILTPHLLGRHVARRAHHHSRHRQRRGVVHRERAAARQTEVEELDAVRREEHVRGLEVAVDDAAAVQRGERRENRQSDGGRVGHGERAVAETVGERFAVEQLHAEERLSLMLADVEELANVGMAHRSRGARFPHEPLAHPWIGGVNDRLDRHGAGQAAIPALVDNPHPAATDLTNDGVWTDRLLHAPEFSHDSVEAAVAQMFDRD